MNALLGAGFFFGAVIYLRLLFKGFDEMSELLAAWIANQKRVAQRGSQGGDR